MSAINIPYSVPTFAPDILEKGAVYSVWMDVTNGPLRFSKQKNPLSERRRTCGAVHRLSARPQSSVLQPGTVRPRSRVGADFPPVAVGTGSRSRLRGSRGSSTIAHGVLQPPSRATSNEPGVSLPDHAAGQLEPCNRQLETSARGTVPLAQFSRTATVQNLKCWDRFRFAGPDLALRAVQRWKLLL